MSRFPVPAPFVNLRGDVDGFCVYLEPQEFGPPDEPVETFPDSLSGYRAVCAARAATSRMLEIFGAPKAGEIA